MSNGKLTSVLRDGESRVEVPDRQFVLFVKGRCTNEQVGRVGCALKSKRPSLSYRPPKSVVGWFKVKAQKKVTAPDSFWLQGPEVVGIRLGLRVWQSIADLVRVCIRLPLSAATHMAF